MSEIGVGQPVNDKCQSGGEQAALAGKDSAAGGDAGPERHLGAEGGSALTAWGLLPGHARLYTTEKDFSSLFSVNEKLVHCLKSKE